VEGGYKVGIRLQVGRTTMWKVTTTRWSRGVKPAGTLKAWGELSTLGRTFKVLF